MEVNFDGKILSTEDLDGDVVKLDNDEAEGKIIAKFEDVVKGRVDS